MTREAQCPAWLERRGYSVRTKARIAAALKRPSSDEREAAAEQERLAEAASREPAANVVAFSDRLPAQGARHAPGAATGAAQPGSTLRLIG